MFDDVNLDFSIKTIEIHSRDLIGDDNQSIGEGQSNLLSGDLVLAQNLQFYLVWIFLNLNEANTALGLVMEMEIP